MRELIESSFFLLFQKKVTKGLFNYSHSCKINHKFPILHIIITAKLVNQITNVLGRYEKPGKNYLSEYRLEQY